MKLPYIIHESGFICYSRQLILQFFQRNWKNNQQTTCNSDQEVDEGGQPCKGVMNSDFELSFKWRKLNFPDQIQKICSLFISTLDNI